MARALRAAAERLAEAGVATPEQDAERLLRHVLRWDRAAVVARSGEMLAPEAWRALQDLVAARATRCPLQHLLGTQHFWRHEFQVGPDVLIPRPETELLVETALELLRETKSPRIVDVGTGSGCIALSLAAERPDAEVHAVDVSGPALAVAGQNALRLGLRDRVVLHHGDLLAPVAERTGSFDLVVSNPPYVDPAQRDSLAPEVRDHEPALALFPCGPPDSAYRRLAPQAANVLKPGAWLAVEIGQGMEPSVARACAEAGFAVTDVRRDLQSIPRVVVARSPRTRSWPEAVERNR